MKKVALVYVLAVFVPSLVLAWLAVRSLRDQQFVLERQQSLLYQGVADTLAKEAGNYLVERQHEFAQLVESLLNRDAPANVARSFDRQLRSQWPVAEVGFAVSLDGDILSPTRNSRAAAQTFLLANSRFLGNRETASVYWNGANAAPSTKGYASNQIDPAFNQSPAPRVENNFDNNRPGYLSKQEFRNVVPQQQSPSFQQDNNTLQNYSKVSSSEAGFRQLIGDSSDGTIARFLENKLTLLLWHHPAETPAVVFGAQVSLAQLKTGMKEVVDQLDPALRGEVVAALLDDSAQPVALSRPGFQANWKHPFVATEIGEALPHWELAVYLLDPAKLSQSARTLELTLGLLVAVLLLAIGVGSWLVVADLNRQLRLARQKTDFVSNVSHELKTPLTSIRMFSELLAEGRVAEPAKQRSYLNIITAEAARLTRLINNVLDFARIERGEKEYDLRSCDFATLILETVESYRPHLESQNFRLVIQPPDSAIQVKGDRDALSQVVVNLLSNAEKYSGDSREIEVQIERPSEPLPYAEARVLDRGLGVPAGCEERIFEQFYRAHDSLASGIQGSGLGLTLARQIARAHQGDVVFQPRPGGGSCFILRLPRCRRN